MEKIFSVRRENGKIMFCPPDAEPIQMVANSRIRIPKWTKDTTWDNKPWNWGLRLVENGKKVAADLQVDGDIVFASIGIFIGTNGTMLVLNTHVRDGKYDGECRYHDISILALMESMNVKKLTYRVPTETSYFERNGLNSVKVFSLDGEQMNDIDGIFTLDNQKPYLIHHTFIRGQNKREWKSLYIPRGWKWTEPAKTAEYDHGTEQVSEQVAAEPASPEAPVEEGVPVEPEAGKAITVSAEAAPIIEQEQAAAPAQAEEPQAEEPQTEEAESNSSVEVTVG